jgi:hypothetical protein
MIMLFVIAAIVVLTFGLFAWRYEATTGGTGGVAKLVHDRLMLMKHRYRKESGRYRPGDCRRAKEREKATAITIR